ncbi:hypothetical protein VA596_09640 [Amycolatopsis sp., V23-08]|uniref:DUF7982 domain-containing protein n=1 Tax=Amycolatopsis heterodermiae TaxID=3110235 RepID=A0ABU5R269_9PSEU|nr:hypothetical protein [Amycolatopsis sp., V23-08]MEA5359799.1 hypothetical protein [Amycolatopsis sp., V23-08]
MRLVSSTCVLAPADTSGTGHGSRKIAPGEWSAQRYWRLAGSVMVVGAVCATVGAVVSSADAREILLALGGFGLAAPIWVYSFTPRWYRTNSASTALTVSADGIGWYRRGQTSFELDWAEVAEVRLTTIEHGGLTLRVIDLFLAKDAGELRGLWQLGAELQNDRLPGEEGACRIPEAFSDAAARQVREAMAVYRPDRYREFTAEVGDMTVAA